MSTIAASLELTPPPLERLAGQAIFTVGLQYGDEGKGKVTDLIVAQVAAVARAQGGGNAGHQIVLENGEVVALHLIPSGVKYPGKLNVIGNGVLVDPVGLQKEIDDIRKKGLEISPSNLAVSGLAHMVLPKHKAQDAARESGRKAQGSTKAGIAFAEGDKRRRQHCLRVEAVQYMSEEELSQFAYKGLRKEKTRRNILGIMRPTKRREAKQLADEFAQSAVKLKDYVQDTPTILNGLLKDGQNVLVEGAQAFGLDINHGKWPNVTSTGCTVAGLIEGTSISPKYIGKRIGVMKLLPSKVGGGTFVTKIKDEQVASAVRGNKGDVDGEYGATTGRSREVGYLDLVQLKRAVEINGIDEIAATKFDLLSRHGAYTKVAVAYLHDTGKVDSGGNKIIERLTIPPSSDVELAKCEPEYKEFKTWTDDSSKEAENYLKFIEEYLKVPITMVSNGPKRDDIIYRDLFSADSLTSDS